MGDRPLGRDKSKRARSNPVVEWRLHDRHLAIEGHLGPRRRGLDPKLLGLEDVQVLVGLAPDERAKGDAGEVSPFGARVGGRLPSPLWRAETSATGRNPPRRYAGTNARPRGS